MFGEILVHFPHDFVTLRLPANELVFSGCSHSTFDRQFDEYYGVSASSRSVVPTIVISVIFLLILILMVRLFLFGTEVTKTTTTTTTTTTLQD